MTGGPAPEPQTAEGAGQRLVAASTRLRSDRGDIPMIIVVFAATILVFYGALHAALVFHGRAVVSAAAQDALRAAQVQDGSAADGRTAAEDTLALSPGLRDKQIQIDYSGGPGCDQVRVVIEATVETPIIDILNDIRVEVVGPCERFYAENERQ